MTGPLSPRRLVVNADDFGRSSAINRAVISAHREGILTTASLMVNEFAVDEAVELAKIYSTDDSSKFVMRIVAKITAQRAPDLRHSNASHASR